MFKTVFCSTLIFFLLTFNLNSQVLMGTVTDSEYNPLIQSEILDTISKKSVSCDFSGSFSMILTSNSVLEISNPNYAPKFFQVSAVQNVDTIFLNFILTDKIQEVSEVIITSERLKKVVDQKNVNIVDYLPFKDCVLTLKTKKSNRFLSVEGIDTTLTEFDLGRTKFKSIFEDCYGNIHLLSKDSAYQIWIDSAFHFISTCSLDVFNDLLKPCVADFQEKSVFHTFTNHNKKLTLTSIDKISKEKEFFYHIHDAIGEKVARSCYWSIISHYYEIAPDYANMIELGVWDGDLLTLNPSDLELIHSTLWYLKIRGVELNVQAFRTDNDIVIFDQFTDSIHVFNEQNVRITSKYYQFEKGNVVFDIIKDRSNNTFYQTTIENGVYTLKSLNHEFTNENSKREIDIREAAFAKNIKVFNDWVYFTIKENDFYGLYRLRIPSK